ncbi:MAG: glycosyltransferase family A protein [bacterium]
MHGISVVIPTCGRPAPLQRALAAVRAQTLAPLEIIVVDDAPSPEAAVPGDAVAAPARLIANPRARRPSAARNAGAALAGGEWLAFLDDDDEWLPDYLASAAALFAAAPLDALCTDLVYRYDDGSERPGKRAPDELVTDEFLLRNPGLIGSNVIVRRATYAALGGFDESLRTSEDIDFGLRLSLHPGLRYAPLHQPLVRHYQHQQDRLCTRRGDAMRDGVRRFYALHGARMNAAQRDSYRVAVRQLWGVDEFGRDVEDSENAVHTKDTMGNEG